MLTEPLIQELITIQRRIAVALEKSPQIEDGFCDVPPSDIKYIFLDGKYPTYWYMLDESGNKINCPKRAMGKAQPRAIAGNIQSLNLTTSVVAGEEKQKLDTWLQTSHGVYVLRTGWESHACKSLLSALVELPESLLKGQIILSPYKLSDKGVDVTKSTARDALFFDVWSQEGKVIGVKREEPDCFAMIKQVNFLLTGEAVVSTREKNKVEISTSTSILPVRSSQLLDRQQLLQQSQELVQTLGWNSSRGREFLVKHYGVKGRSLLDDEQLIHFVGKLQELAAIAV